MGDDSTLDTLYGSVDAKYHFGPAALRKLQTAQRVWLTYRDAQLGAPHSAVDRARAYGSVLSVCTAAPLEELTTNAHRTASTCAPAR